MLKSTVPETVKTLTIWGEDVTIRREFDSKDEAVEWCENLNDEVEVKQDSTNVLYIAVSPDKNYRVTLVAYVKKRQFNIQN